MKIDSRPLRYAHAEGYTDVCYTEDGQHIITCGNDGDVRIWVDIKDDDRNSHCVGESATAVCFKDKRLYVATDNHAVQAYTFLAFDKDGIVTRFTASVTQIMTSTKIEALGCTSENMEAKICSPEGGAPLFMMSEHKGPVLSIALCPQMKYSATSCGDGMLRIWDIDTQKMVKEIACVPKRIKCAISQCRFSPCGQYLAASTIAGQIAVWEVQSGTCTGIIEHPTSHNVTAIAWNPKGNGVLAYCDVSGQLGALMNCYGKDSKADADAPDDVEMVERADDGNDLDNLIENYNSDDDDNAISLEKLKNETLGLGTVRDEDESRPVSRHEPAATTVPPQAPFQLSATPGHLEHRYMCWNDIGIVRCHTQENGESTIDVEFHDTNLHHGINLNNYLNHTMASLSASVLVLACETSSVHDFRTRNKSRMKLGIPGCQHNAFRRNPRTHEAGPARRRRRARAARWAPMPGEAAARRPRVAKLVCISLVGSSKEWSVSMPDTEEILCVTAGSDVVACATNARLLRLFTPMGTQRQV
ncbi:WD repeat and HMG-box DNA-binding protein 1-like [Cydia fagiglandana]|uniref:WD repeat and HMG-box DNA-binding protein 1-like n=1 Tax=Cydia fagiglandana TaxID=1458189 RepID=UPI002FEE2E2F